MERSAPRITYRKTQRGLDDTQGPRFFDEESLYHGHRLATHRHTPGDAKLDDQRMVLHFIDVGQGDATVLEFACGAVLIDTGGESDGITEGAAALMRWLDRFFNRRTDLRRTLNAVVLSHPHIDHTRGARLLIEGPEDGKPWTPITIQGLVDNGFYTQGSGKAGQKFLMEHVTQNGGRHQPVSIDLIDTYAGFTNDIIDPVAACAAGGTDPTFHALWGLADPDWSSAWKNQNNHSVLLRVGFGQTAMLFTGDLEDVGMAEVLRAYQDDLSALDVDILKVGHHGSHNATTEDWLRATTPWAALIGVGNPNGSQETHSAYCYGHPREIALRRLVDPNFGVTGTRDPILAAVGASACQSTEGARVIQMKIDKAVFATGWDGTISIFIDANGEFEVLTER